MSQGPYVEAPWVTELKRDAALGKQLIAILSNHCGEPWCGTPGTSEGAVETLNRIIRQRGAGFTEPSSAYAEGWAACREAAVQVCKSVYLGDTQVTDVASEITCAKAIRAIQPPKE